MNPTLMALGAELTIVHADREPRTVPLRAFFLDYRKVDLASDGEIVQSVRIPPPAGPYEYVRCYKQARRRDDDISIVCACVRVVLSPDAAAGHWAVDDASVCFGGMSKTSVAAPETESVLQGGDGTGSSGVWNAATLALVYDALKRDLPLPKEVPGGMSEYRQALCSSFLFKFFIDTSMELSLAVDSGGDVLPPAPVVADVDRSAAETFLTAPQPLTGGMQSYTPEGGALTQMKTTRTAQGSAVTEDEVSDAKTTTRSPVGKPLMHKSAIPQVTGEAIYVDDIPTPASCLHGALVLTTEAHARIVQVDAAPAEAVEGFVAFYTASDVTGINEMGAIAIDEECFATVKCTAVGQPIGIVVAETPEAAAEAARCVAVQYEALPAILSINDALEHIKAAEAEGVAALAAADELVFFPEAHTIARGEVESALAGEGITIVEGEAHVGGQEHFYLECNATLAMPDEDGRGMEVFASTQNPTKTQNFVANVSVTVE